MSSIYDSLSKAGTTKVGPDNLHLNIPRNPQIIKPPKSSRPSGGTSRFVNAVALLFALASLAGTVYCILGLLAGQQTQQGLETRQQQLMGFSQSLEARTSEYRKEIDQVRNQLETLSVDKADLQKEVSRSRIEISNLEKTVLDIQEKTRKLDQIVKERLPALPLPSAVDTQLSGVTPVSFQPVSPSGSSVPAQPQNVAQITVSDSARVTPQESPAITQPQVMTVNRKFNFVVINIGMNDKLKMGDRLRVERDGKGIGTVEVEKLYDSFSAATIIDEKKNKPIQEGDSVEKA